jgi:hypothetical protein
MATNVYRSEQRISYNADAPTSYFGWEYSWGGGENVSLHVFTKEPSRQRFVDKVKAAIGRTKIRDGFDVEDLAAFFALRRYGSDEAAAEMLHNMLSAPALERLELAFEDFDLSELEDEAGRA